MTAPLITTTVCTICRSGDRTVVDWPGDHPLWRCATCGAIDAAGYADPAAVDTDGYHSGLRGAKFNSLHPDMVAYVEETAAHARNSGLDVTRGRLEDLDDTTYDVISALHVIEHLPDATGALRALVQRVRPGGRLLVDAITRAGATPTTIASPSWVAPPQIIAQAWSDLGLRNRPALRGLLSHRNGQVEPPAWEPNALGWAFLWSVERLWSRGKVGMVVAIVATRPEATT